MKKQKMIDELRNLRKEFKLQKDIEFKNNIFQNDDHIS